MANQYTHGGIVDRDNYIQLLDNAIDEVFDRDGMVPVDNSLAELFHSFDIGAGESFTATDFGSELGLPELNEDQQALPLATSPQGYEKSFVVRQRRLAIAITRSMIEKDRFGKIQSLIQGLPRVVPILQEYQRVAVIGGGFSATTTADGVALFYDSHPLEHPAAGTADNLGTGALAYETLQALRLLSQKMVDARGYPMAGMPMTLWIPPDLEQRALEITKSELRYDTDTNARTVLVDGLTLKVNKYLGSASTSAYFLSCDLQGPQKGLWEVYLARPNLADSGEATTDIPIHKRIRMSNVVDAMGFRNIYGSQG